MKPREKILCGNCDAILKDMARHCKFCGSATKNVLIDFVDQLPDIKDTIEGKVINPSLRSKDKMREKFFDGVSQSTNGDWAEKNQIINRDKDYYFEEIKNSEGIVIHICEEKLSEHKGHGSDKFNNPASH